MTVEIDVATLYIGTASDVIVYVKTIRHLITLRPSWCDITVYCKRLNVHVNSWCLTRDPVAVRYMCRRCFALPVPNFSWHLPPPNFFPIFLGGRVSPAPVSYGVGHSPPPKKKSKKWGGANVMENSGILLIFVSCKSYEFSGYYHI